MLDIKNTQYPNTPGRVGGVRPSATMYTAGVGALVDLPHLSVVINGLDDWDLRHATKVEESRLLDVVRHHLGDQVDAMFAPPHLADDGDLFGDWTRVGIPVTPFPRWLRCTKRSCKTLGRMDSGEFELDFKPVNTDQTQFRHKHCRSGQGRANSRAITARFVLVCPNGHLDDFPYDYFVHGTPQTCPAPRYTMEDRGQGLGPNVWVTCVECGTAKSMLGAFGAAAESTLPACRGRNPQLGMFDADGCQAPARAMVLGASNMWFAQGLTSLYLPESGGDLPTLVRDHWAALHEVETLRELQLVLNAVQIDDLAAFDAGQVFDAIEARRNPENAAPAGEPDLKKPEWDAFTAGAAGLIGGTSDFRLRSVNAPPITGISSVLLVERLRAAKAFIGFTRIGPYDPEDQGNIRPGRMTRGRTTWVPATDARGEGIFIRFDEDLLTDWEDLVRRNGTLQALWVANRTRNQALGRPDHHGWIGERGVLLHTFSHALIRQLALDCGYSSASLSERIYHGTPTDPQAGVLIYTTAADAEGTLGGLVNLGETANLTRIITAALDEAALCSADPLCAEHAPNAETGALNGAACHLCLHASETTCEFNNRFLDRRVIADIGLNPTPFFSP